MADELEGATGTATAEAPASPNESELRQALGFTGAGPDGAETRTEAKTSAPAQVTTKAPVVDKALVDAILSQLKPELDNRFNPVRQSVGKLEKLQNDLLKQSQPKPQAPAVWNNLKPEEQSAYGDLISHYLQSQLGIPLTEMKEFFNTAPSFIKQAQQQQQYSQVETLAKSYAGKDWESLNPIMADLYTEASKAAKAGDESAAVWIKEFETTQAGVMNAVNIARQRLSEKAQATSQVAEGKREAGAKKAGTALSNAGSTGGSQFSLENLPKGNTPESRAKLLTMLEAELGVSR